jgi:hypothetical protein
MCIVGNMGFGLPNAEMSSPFTSGRLTNTPVAGEWEYEF